MPTKDTGFPSHPRAPYEFPGKIPETIIESITYLVLRPPTNRSAIHISAPTYTTDVKLLDLNVTWNNAGVTFTGLKLAITDTASAVASKALDVLVGGTSILSLRKDGSFITPLKVAGIAANTTNFSLSGGSLTGSSVGPLIDWAVTLNTSGLARAFRLNITNTASATNSPVFDVQLSGSSFLRVETSGGGGTGSVIASGSTFRVQRAGTGIDFLTVSTSGSGSHTNHTPFLVTTTSTFDIRRTSVGGAVLLSWDDQSPINAVMGANFTAARLTGTRLTIINATDTDQASDIPLSIADNWSNNSNVRKAIFVNVTDNGSGASLLLDLQIGSTTRLSLSKHGTLNLRPTTGNSALTTAVTYTGAATLIDLAVTWNSAIVFTAIKLNVTDTSSDAASLLLDLQVGGSTVFAIDKTGAITAGSFSGAISASVIVTDEIQLLSAGFLTFTNPSAWLSFSDQLWLRDSYGTEIFYNNAAGLLFVYTPGASAAKLVLSATDSSYRADNHSFEDAAGTTSLANLTAAGLIPGSTNALILGHAGLRWSTVYGVAGDFTGTVTANAFSGPLTGNASTATALQTARNINGVAFDGTANITVAAAAGTLTGTTLASGVVTSSLTSVGTLTSLTTSGTLTTTSTNLLLGSNAGGSANFSMNAAAATLRQILFQSAGVNRWIIRVASDAESGSDAGSGFQIIARDDSGAQIDVPISITRAAGGTLVISRPVSISAASFALGANGAATTTMNISAAAGQFRLLAFNTNSGNRWLMGANATAESGSDAGSNFEILARTDGGSSIDTPISIVRAAGGAITLARRLVTPATTSTRAFLNLPHGTAPSSPVDGDIWTTSAGIYVRINGATVGPLN